MIRQTPIITKKREYDKQYYLKNKEKILSRCKDWKNRNKEKTNKYRSEYYRKNKKKMKQRSREWASKNKERIQSIGLKHKYGISLAEKLIMAKNQENACAICRKKVEKLVVDHSHETRKIRGLLCDPCNHLLGNACDDVNILESAILYLNSHNL